MKLYRYPNFQPHDAHESEELFKGHSPLSDAGIAEHCELVSDPDEADFLYMGQFHSSHDGWLLHPNRFPEFLTGREDRHIVELEGDLCLDHWPVWLEKGVIIAASASPDCRNRNVFVRPACSKLLLDLVARETFDDVKPRRGFFFRGQRDIYGVRENVRLALKKAGVPHEFEFMPGWNAPTDAGSPVVRAFERDLKRWSFSLCPGGMGLGMTVRFFETCGLGRTPVVVARNWLFEEAENSYWLKVMGPYAPVDQLARWFRWIYDQGSEDSDVARAYFGGIKRYFADPTGYFLGWMQKRGLV